MRPDLRGQDFRHPQGAQVHLLAALDQAEQIVLAQIDVVGTIDKPR